MSADDRETASKSMSRRSLSGMIVGGIGLFAARQSTDAEAKTEATTNAEDQAGIEQLIYRHALALDNRDSAAFADCFHSSFLTPAGAEKTIEFHRKFEYTAHNVLNHSYTVQDRTATGMHYSLVCYAKNTAGKLTKFDTYARYENVQLGRGITWEAAEYHGNSMRPAPGGRTRAMPNNDGKWRICDHKEVIDNLRTSATLGCVAAFSNGQASKFTRMCLF